MGGLADFPRPVGLEVGHLHPLAEGLRRRGQPLDRPDLVADEGDGQGRQHEGRPGQPHDEHVAPGREGPIPRGIDAQHPAPHLHPDLEEGGIAGGVEPEVLRQPVVDGIAQGLVEARQHPAAGMAGGQGPARMIGQPQELGAFRPVGDVAEGHRRRIGLEGCHIPGNVTGEGLRQLGRHGLPIGFEEHPGHRDLHHRHWQDDDQEGAGKQRGGGPALEQPGPEMEATPARPDGRQTLGRGIQGRVRRGGHRGLHPVVNPVPACSRRP